MSKNLSSELQKISETKIETQDQSTVDVTVNSLQVQEKTENDLDHEIDMLLQEESAETPKTSISHRDIWDQLINTFDEDRKAVADYKSSKSRLCDVPTSNNNLVSNKKQHIL